MSEVSDATVIAEAEAGLVQRRLQVLAALFALVSASSGLLVLNGYGPEAQLAASLMFVMAALLSAVLVVALRPLSLGSAVD